MHSKSHGRVRPHRNTFALRLIALIGLAAAATAQAGEVKLDSNGFNASSDDGLYTFGIHGRVQWDGAWFDNDDRGSDNISGTELRRVRLAVSGKLADWGYLADFDFAGNEVTGQTIALSHALWGGTVAIGQVKPFMSLEYTTDDLWASMQERAWIADTMGPGYRYGAQWIAGSGHFVYGANLYNEANTDSDKNNGIGGGGRVVWLPLARDQGVLHLGVDVMRDQFGRGPDDVYTGYSNSVRLAGHMSDKSKYTLIDFDDGAQVDVNKYIGEFAYSRGPFYVQSEYGHADYDADGQDADLDTGYATVGWFITGQTRGYDYKKARFTRPDNIGEYGAWEVALRYDTARGQQVDSDIKATATTLGVNWYATRNVLFRLDLVHSEAKDRLTNTTLDKTNAVTARAQIAF